MLDSSFPTTNDGVREPIVDCGYSWFVTAEATSTFLFAGIPLIWLVFDKHWQTNILQILEVNIMLLLNRTRFSFKCRDRNCEEEL